MRIVLWVQCWVGLVFGLVVPAGVHAGGEFVPDGVEVVGEPVDQSAWLAADVEEGGLGSGGVPEVGGVEELLVEAQD